MSKRLHTSKWNLPEMVRAIYIFHNMRETWDEVLGKGQEGMVQRWTAMGEGLQKSPTNTENCQGILGKLFPAIPGWEGPKIIVYIY